MTHPGQPGQPFPPPQGTPGPSGQPGRPFPPPGQPGAFGAAG